MAKENDIYDKNKNQHTGKFESHVTVDTAIKHRVSSDLCTTLSSSSPPPPSSSSMELQLWYSLGLLNNIFQFKTILDLFYPFYKFHLFQVLPDIVFPSGLGPSYWSSCEWFPFVYFLYNTGFRNSIYVSKPAQSQSSNIIYRTISTT